jgi:hypothetical protein
MNYQEALLKLGTNLTIEKIERIVTKITRKFVEFDGGEVTLTLKEVEELL